MAKFRVWFRKGGKAHYRTVVAETKSEAMAKVRATGKTPISVDRR